ncbi:MAG: RNA methyltransferase [Firmicutes bacterium]|nr:RNA methyltransferase [Candidatus Caballimonas caccae]
MITSRANETIKFVRSLKDKKNRDDNNVFIVESIKLTLEALNSGFTIKKLFVTEEVENEFSAYGVETVVVSLDVFKSISNEVSPQGVLAIVEKPSEKPFVKKNCLLLDGVSDPGNVGAIIRTAAATDFTEIFLINCADPFNSKSIRASMGGLFKVNLHTVNREDAIDKIGLPLVVADMYGENIFNFRKNDFVCLVIGNEGNGVSDFIKSKASYTVSIPMENGMESLNASVSAGILMYLLK